MIGLRRYLDRWNQSAADKAARLSAPLHEIDAHTRLAESPNLYTTHDIGTKNIRYSDGRTRSLRVRKVVDTAGRSLVHLPDAPLS